MVTNSATFGRSGVHDFMLIRATAVILTLYTIYLVGFIAFNDITYDVWTGFFDRTFTKVFTLLALFSVLMHGWIGAWQVLSDYVKPAFWRGLAQFGVVVLLLVYLLTGIVVLWGV
ncbi:succinate dehydrogenase, hydrophobic membrane anchor protein [Zobellella taiwanensis]|jgi:succinate dehydrogenase / fumarate reductase membrane anchor subunit|uniref:Succinate dehydrogenase hydrophobic membrane anchor subunit n=1 Tax=Zobellella taiwanensis TaxID=347535 RepID=A0A2P7QJQ9_9GAMM|nr:succinate dehydrogenase, hydrophobic membrane anchor protein [Zobellella taiwanensis]PSJ38194.1 succinate dehydrogenase, hydrophobic membrane anchor protein [Zobellella taiwanensis]